HFLRLPHVRGINTTHHASHPPKDTRVPHKQDSTILTHMSTPSLPHKPALTSHVSHHPNITRPKYRPTTFIQPLISQIHTPPLRGSYPSSPPLPDRLHRYFRKLRSLCCCQQRLIIDSNETATHPRITIRAGKIVEHVTRLRVSPPKLLPIGESPTTRPLKLRIPSERPFFTYRLVILN